MQIPQGFVLYEKSAFAVTFGPVYLNDEGVTPIMGLRADSQHMNTMDAVHGGLILALADTSLGSFVKSKIDVDALAVTVDLHATFMLGIRSGQWIEVHPTIDRLGRMMVFTTGSVTADGREVARVVASFHIHRRRSATKGETDG